MTHLLHSAPSQAGEAVGIAGVTFLSSRVDHSLGRNHLSIFFEMLSHVLECAVFEMSDKEHPQHAEFWRPS